jgi:radical SAM superfamily enzyme YgiQ (UPF0313 family)
VLAFNDSPKRGKTDEVIDAMKRLLLINPVGQKSGFLLSRFSKMPPLSLAYIAAVTPDNWEVIVLDENVDVFQPLEADLVGITAFTSSINRAYEIADLYRSRNTKVVIGGIHASMLPEESLNYADAVVVGEAEGIWPKVLADFESNRLSGKYQGPRIDLERAGVRPRRDVIHPSYLFQTIQTSRGCPFNCNFCTVSRYLGRTYRQRHAGDVLDELCEIQGRYLFFVDDNLVGYTSENRRRAVALFEGMIARGMDKKWWMQTSINTADDERVIALAAKAGCMFAFIGFETISQASLLKMKKDINIQIGVDSYKKVVDAFHKHGIGVVGAFIIGNDHESPGYYRELSRFLVRSGIDVVQLAILTPLPGTRFFDMMKEEGRLLHQTFPKDWAKYRMSYVVREMEGVAPETVYTGNNHIKRQIYSFPRYPYRMMKSLISLKHPSNFYAVFRFNQAMKRSWVGAHYFNAYPHRFGASTDHPD